jgi:hypothetical protein
MSYVIEVIGFSNLLRSALVSNEEEEACHMRRRRHVI